MLKKLLASLATLAVVTVPTLASAARDHVLIMTISEYREKPLPGVKHDAQNALALARRLGYDTSRARTYRDAELAGQGILQSLKTVEADTQEGDRVFVYYSGHGASYMKNDICEQALVSQDNQIVGMDDLHAWANRIRDKARDVVFVVDACHSGGLGNIVVSSATRAAKSGDAKPAWTPKLWQPKDAKECSSPVNRAKNLQPQYSTRNMAPPEAHMVVISAANEREVALDDPNSGGLASTALLQCATGGVKDQDGSGAVDYAELRNCAQQRLNQTISSDGRGYSVHHIEVRGNPAMAVPIAVASNSPSVSRADAVESAFRQIESNSDAGWGLTVDVATPVVQLGQKATVNFSLTRPGYIYLLYVGSSRTDMKQLIPAPGGSEMAQNDTIEMPIESPAGTNSFLLVATEKPYDFGYVFLSTGNERITSDNVKSLQRSVLFRDVPSASLKKNPQQANTEKPKMVARSFVIRGQ